MAEEIKKQFKEALQSELSPLIIGLRNELKVLGEKLDVIKSKEPPEIVKSEITNYPESPEISKVEVINPIEKIEITNPQTIVEIKELEPAFSSLKDYLGKIITELNDGFSDKIDELSSEVLEVRVQNQKDVKFPEVQKVEVQNQVKQIEAVRVLNSKPEDAIPVVLVEKTFQKYYDLANQYLMANDVNLDSVKKLLEQIDYDIQNITIDIGEVTVDLGELDDLAGLNPFHSYDTADIVGSVETDLVTYTVPTGKKARIKVIHATGGSDCELALKIGSNVVHKARSAWNDRNIQSFFEGLEASAGEVVKITITHDEVVNITFYGDIDGILL